MMTSPRPPRFRSALVALAAIMVIAPTAAIASHDFSDVPNTNIFHADIEWMLENGVTTGCGSGNYCPSDYVTREQMAAFMKRLSTSKIVNAATAETADSANSLMGTLPGAFTAPVSFSFSSTSPVEAAAMDITVPGPGLIVVTVSGNIWIDADSASTSSLAVYAILALCADSAAICETDTFVHYTDPDNANVANSTPGFSLSLVLPVTAAGTETVYLNGWSPFGYPVRDSSSTNMLAIFLPGDGAANLSGSVSVASESSSQVDSE